MRNLTLCAIVVSGGVLASLPFRRPVGPTELPATSSPVVASTGLATGPTQSPFALSAHDMGGPLETRSTAGMAASRFESTRSRGMWSESIPSNMTPRPRRSVDLPLTFDDLAVPLETPHYNDHRFDAVAKQVAPVMDAASGPQRFIAMDIQTPTAAPSQTPAGLVAPQLATKSEAAVVRGRLAATDFVAGKPEAQPVESAATSTPTEPPSHTTAPVRERHWIRQPR